MESLQKKIQERAYDLFRQRGSKPGHAMEDWIRAEKEITSQKAAFESKSAPARPVESYVIENKKQSQPGQKQDMDSMKKGEKRFQSANSRNF
jgi:hypothetical protein